jgi:hypothetical protein
MQFHLYGNLGIEIANMEAYADKQLLGLGNAKGWLKNAIGKVPICLFRG